MKSESQESVPKQAEEVKEATNPTIHSLVATNNLKASSKLQKKGYKVIAITGGIQGDAKTHYFHTTIEKIQSEIKKDVFDKADAETFFEVNEIAKSKSFYSDLEQRIKNPQPVHHE